MNDIRIEWDSSRVGGPDSEIMHCDILIASDPTLLTDRETDLIAELKAIHGVEKVALGTYCVMIFKGRVFSWDEVKPRVEHTVKSWDGQVDESKTS